MDRIVLSLFGGLTVGSTYSLIALGLVVAFRSTATFNFAHGQFMLLGAFVLGRWQARATGSFGVGLIVALAVVAAVGALFYLVVLQRMVGLPHWMSLVASLGLAAILDGVMTLVYGTDQYEIHIPGLPTGTVEIVGARLSTASLVTAVGALLLAAVVALVLRFTHLGIKVRAAGQDALLASQGGINVGRVFIGAWAVAGALAAIAGVAYGTTNLVNPSLIEIALFAFPVLLLGGVDSVEGAIVGGLAIGVMQGFAATYLGGEYLDVLTYGLLLVVLLVRPRGLFGTEQVTKI